MMNCIEQDSLNRRRSVYGLGKLPEKSLDCVKETIEACILNCPSAFNVQSARVVLLLNNEHENFWDKVWQKIKSLVSKEQKSASEQRITGFKQAHGTLLFFEDNKALQKLKKQIPQYAKNVTIWSQQSNAMLQYMIWSALAENNIGASLQHYNELISAELNQALALPKSWKLIAQMPFGTIEKEPPAKTFLPLENRFIIKK